jgi:hypothetical protein
MRARIRRVRRPAARARQFAGGDGAYPAAAGAFPAAGGIAAVPTDPAGSGGLIETTRRPLSFLSRAAMEAPMYGHFEELSRGKQEAQMASRWPSGGLAKAEQSDR